MREADSEKQVEHTQTRRKESRLNYVAIAELVEIAGIIGKCGRARVSEIYCSLLALPMHLCYKYNKLDLKSIPPLKYLSYVVLYTRTYIVGSNFENISQVW